MQESIMDILELIPQRPPIVMVDNFLSLEEGISYTDFTIREDNVFLDGGKMTECGLIEHIAQSAAARVGYIFRSQGEDVPLGYIGSVNKMTVKSLPSLGDTVRTSIVVIQEVMGISLVEAHTWIGDEEIADCKMKIFLDLNGSQEK
jgi:predicted hotdog family 3-hydroxylacyl-ACP dehydratase